MSTYFPGTAMPRMQLELVQSPPAIPIDPTLVRIAEALERIAVQMENRDGS